MEESRGTTGAEGEQENALVSHTLSPDEAKLLARIAKDRRNGFMVSARDVDFLLEIIERLNQ